jgi:hypothetical protein
MASGEYAIVPYADASCGYTAHARMFGAEGGDCMPVDGTNRHAPACRTAKDDAIEV